MDPDLKIALYDQLQRIFPQIEEEFLKGLCEKYRSENPNIADLVEDVISVEFPPLKQIVGQGATNESVMEEDPNIMKAMLIQLQELFPHIEEHFLKGLCDAYESENPTLDDMVENVFSIEFPPLKDGFEKDVDSIVANVRTDINTEVSDNPSNSKRNSHDTGDFTASTSEISLSSSDSGICVLKECNSPSEQRKKLNEVLSKSSCESSGFPHVQIKTDLKNFNFHICLPAAILDSEDISNDTECETLEHIFDESDDQLNREDIKSWDLIKDSFERINEPQNFDIDLKNAPLIKEEVQENSTLNNEAEDDVSHPSTSVISVDIPSTSFSDLSGSQTMYENGGEVENELDFKPYQQSISSLEVPNSKTNKAKEFKRKARKPPTQRPRVPCAKLPSGKSRFVSQKRIKDPWKKESRGSLASSPQFRNAEAKYSLLQKVLPDAEQSFLISQSEIISSNEDLLAFIAKALENGEYPKEDSEEPIIMEKFECTLEDFLREIPDPVAEFSSKCYTRAGYKENAEIYLKSRYPSRSEQEIRENLELYEYNITEISEIFDSEGTRKNPSCLENLILHHTASVFFHQEVWYIEHKKEIDDYLASAIEAVKIDEELNRPPTPVPVEEVFECGICADEIVEYIELVTCDGPQGHIFCRNCLRRNTEVKIGEGAVKFPCLHGCDGFIPLQTIEEVLPAEVFAKLMDKIQEEEVRVANVAGLETCPFCPFAYGPGDEEYFTCKKPSCMKISCRTCRKEAHGNQICDMFQQEDEETARHLVENRMAEALIRYCHSCKKPIVKTSGCNKMTCICGAKMCYVCRAPVQDYSHFNGQGGDHTERCPLFTDDNTVHDRPVAESGAAAFNEIRANNPGLNLDPSKIIPK